MERKDFFVELQTYFKENYIDGAHYPLTPVENESHAYIYYKQGLMINVRVKDGVLNDVCAFIEGRNAKRIFDELLKEKDFIEEQIGYKLVWDRNDAKYAVRIGRFGKKSTSPNRCGLDEVVPPFDFDLDKEKIAVALVDFYKTFVPRVRDIVENLK